MLSPPAMLDRFFHQARQRHVGNEYTQRGWIHLALVFQPLVEAQFLYAHVSLGGFNLFIQTAHAISALAQRVAQIIRKTACHFLGNMRPVGYLGHESIERIKRKERKSTRLNYSH